ncbi:unnamed protein product [Adineta steineri]|uniref:Uncharacterized protein n=1 Tax=Adineta steineri TaxID=433720 RepID=A0A814LNB7_9BILA|nr:unnamed protein product [Adineta steineri]
MQAITTLNLDWNKIGADGAQHLADALRTNKTLTTLNLDWNEIGADGAQYIADILRHNTVTIHLFLIYCIYSSTLFHAETNRVKPGLESYQRYWSTTSSSWTTNEYGN